MSGRKEHHHQHGHHTVPLAVLLKRELVNEKIEKSDLVVVYSQASENKKGEDFTLIKTERQRVVADGVSTYSVFGVCFCFFNYNLMDCIVLNIYVIERLQMSMCFLVLFCI